MHSEEWYKGKNTNIYKVWVTIKRECKGNEWREMREYN